MVAYINTYIQSVSHCLYFKQFQMVSPIFEDPFSPLTQKGAEEPLTKRPKVDSTHTHFSPAKTSTPIEAAPVVQEPMAPKPTFQPKEPISPVSQKGAISAPVETPSTNTVAEASSNKFSYSLVKLNGRWNLTIRDNSVPFQPKEPISPVSQKGDTSAPVETSSTNSVAEASSNKFSYSVVKLNDGGWSFTKRDNSVLVSLVFKNIGLQKSILLFKCMFVYIAYFTL